MKTPNDAAVEGIDLDGMQSFLEDTPVSFALLFGSTARGEADSTSDVDVALRFPTEVDAHERFRLRNRIDAQLQQYADSFVDVSDIERLPRGVALAVVRDGILLTGNEEVVERYRGQIETEYESTMEERKRERREFIDRLASGDA